MDGLGNRELDIPNTEVLWNLYSQDNVNDEEAKKGVACSSTLVKINKCGKFKFMLTE